MADHPAPATILAIESSCDDTGAAVCMGGTILSNQVAGQQVHIKYGGVVPELASRAHMQHIVPVVDTALQEAGILPAALDAIAFTQSPGLIGSLLVGAEFAKSLALALNKPLIAVHHMQAHVLANLIEEPRPRFPFLCLTVSGGHTQLVVCHSPSRLELIGQTLDDAAGEAFDKTAKILGLPYPGGPLVDTYAKQGNPERFHFPEPQIEGLNFSFSGLKTAILYFVQKETARDPLFVNNNMADICASVQQRIVSILLHKLEQASRHTGIQQVCIAGGVSANSALRRSLAQTGAALGWQTYTPAFAYCTDNAAMIAMAGYYKFLENDFSTLSVVPAAR